MTVNLHFVKMDLKKGEAKEIAVQNFMPPKATEAGANPSFVLMPGGTLVTYYYYDNTFVQGKPTGDHGIIKTFDVRTGSCLQTFDKGIKSGMSKLVF